VSQHPEPTAPSWAASWPELVIGGLLAAALTAAAYAFAGAGAATAVLIVTAAVTLAALRFLPQSPPAAPPDGQYGQRQNALLFINDFWRRRANVADATKSLASFDHTLREPLQHLLAARLSERHGISFYTDPDAARRLLFAGQPDPPLWFWLDPARSPAAPGDSRPGIRPRTLAVRHPGQRPHPAGGPARPGQDSDGAVLRPRTRPGLRPDPVHPGPASLRRGRRSAV
jgi:hypothetical protein